LRIKPLTVTGIYETMDELRIFLQQWKLREKKNDILSVRISLLR
jgi:hypothetical protein